MIDFVITNRAITPSQILEVRVLTSANLGTDHKLVLCKMLMEQPRKVIKKPIYIRKFNIESLSTESTRQLYELRLSSRLNNICIAGEVEEGWQQIKTCITEAAAE
ncbi:hypothetical protein WA026_014791 [Henosepilachna vigintioctopunctata]|uniref:Uncharacterized protein n=1 Tax=Henosepilachna vigintioctopunctata TaxID=420089 RepID=A0AAW1UXZ0_9CUCU